MADVALKPAPEVETLPPEIEALSQKPYPNMPPGFVIRTVMALRKFLQRLADALVPADVVAFERSTGGAVSQLVGAAARYRIADLLAKGPLTTAEIAARIGTD